MLYIYFVTPNFNSMPKMECIPGCILLYYQGITHTYYDNTKGFDNTILSIVISSIILYIIYSIYLPDLVISYIYILPKTINV